MNNKNALVVGINMYNENSLKYCVNDAQYIAGILSEPEYGYKVTTMVDQQATRHNIRAALDRLTKEKVDNFLFYFAGHGTTNDLGASIVSSDYSSVE